MATAVAQRRGSKDAVARRFEPRLRSKMHRRLLDLRTATSHESIVHHLLYGQQPDIVGAVPWDEWSSSIEVTKANPGDDLARIAAEIAQGTGSPITRADIQRITQAWAQQHSADLARDLSAKSQKVLAQQVGRLMQARPPSVHAVATTIKNMIGLTPSQANAVRNYADALQEGITGRQLGRLYTLSPVQAGDRTISETRFDSLVDRYAARQVAWRANAIAETESVRAANAGEWLAWDEARAQGLIDGDRSEATWYTAEDERVCDDCNSLDQETVPFTDQFGNDGVGYVDWPPLHPLCRCEMEITPVYTGA